MATRARKNTAPASGPPMPSGGAFIELGTSGTAIYGGYVATIERNAKVTGQTRYVTASNILANISIVAASLRYFLNLVAKAKWSVNPADDSPEAKAVAEFVESCMVDMATQWSRIVRRSSMFRFHGFSMQEWTAKKRADGMIGFADIESRPQKTIGRWSTDDGGTINGVWQTSPQTGQEIALPRWKLIYMVDDMLTDSPEGMGWFRHLVEPCDRLTQYLKLEAMGFERDLSGTPVGWAPITAINRAVKAGTLTRAEGDAMLDAIKRFVALEVKKENTGMVLDSQPFESSSADGKQPTGNKQWGIDIITGKAESIDALNTAVERIERQMARIMGTEGLMIGGDGVGSLALSKDKSRSLFLNVNSTLIDMAEAMTNDFAGPLLTLNGIDESLWPEMVTEEIAFRDVEEVTTALRDMATAGAVLSPMDDAITDVRDLLGISHPPEFSLEQLGALTSPTPEETPPDSGDEDPNAVPEENADA